MKKSRPSRPRKKQESDVNHGVEQSNLDGVDGEDGSQERVAVLEGEADEGDALAESSGNRAGSGNRASNQGVSGQAASDEDDLDEVDPFNSELVAEPQLTVSLSKALVRKIMKLAQDEGVGVEDLVQELIAEGVVLRAWEVITRKNVQSGSHQSQGNKQGQPGQGRQGNNNRNNKNRGRFGKRPPGGGGGGAGNWMEDKAAFLEYVRNQERGRR